MWDEGELTSIANALVRAAADIGVALGAHQAAQMVRHKRLVYDTNEHTNLTRVPASEALALHVIDSLSGLAAMQASPDGAWLDIGSGAGYPGVPLQIASGRHVDLLESVGRKARFLEQVVRELCLDATVRQSRAEDAANETPAAYAAVSARAVSELPALVELASPLLATGGRLVCWKGEPTSEEVERGDKVAARTGMRRIETTDVSLPSIDAKRTLVVYERTRATSVKLPRRVGLAQSKPLA